LAAELALGLQPRALGLLHPPPGGWQRALRRVPLLAVLLAAIVPNGLASLFNVSYNLQHIQAHSPELEAAFWTTLLGVNAIAFPVGLALMAWLTWPVARALGRLRAGLAPPPERLGPLRRRCWHLGHYAALLGVAEWLAAGLLFPLLLHAAAGTVGAATYAHFILSLTLCGLLAAVYPFFVITFLGVRAYAPAFIRPGQGAFDVPELVRLGRLLWRYLGLAASVPMLGVAVLVLTGSGSQLALGVFSAAGLAGFGLVSWAFRVLQADLAALHWALEAPQELLDHAGDSVGSFPGFTSH
jgi:hypothetical protein